MTLQTHPNQSDSVLACQSLLRQVKSPFQNVLTPLSIAGALWAGERGQGGEVPYKTSTSPKTSELAMPRMKARYSSFVIGAS
jgi:hypothetical protein